jgi:hypothetical protein
MRNAGEERRSFDVKWNKLVFGKSLRDKVKMERDYIWETKVRRQRYSAARAIAGLA